MDKFDDLRIALDLMLIVGFALVLGIIVGLVYIARADNVKPYTYKGEVVACMKQ